MNAQAAHITVSTDVAHDSIDGEVVAIQLTTGVYFSLVGMAAEVWESIAIGTDAATITAAIRAAIPTADAAPEAVTTFLHDLEHNGLIVTTDTDAPVAGPSITVTDLATLRVEAFTDMQELLLLDPVHDVDANVGWPAVDPSTDQR